MMILLILTLLLRTCYVDADLQKFVDVVTSVQQNFASGCIYLLRDQSEQFTTTLMTTRASKLIFKKYIQTTLSSRNNGSLGCQKNRPLFVIPDKDRSLTQNVTSSAIWLKFLETQSLSDFVADNDIPFDSEFIVAQPEDDDRYVLNEVYRVSPALPLQTSTFGTWINGRGLHLPKIGFHERRNGLLGASLRTAVRKGTVADSSGIYSERRNLEGVYFMEVWNILSRIMDFKPKYVIPAQSVFGSRMKNNSWNGVTGMLQRKEADVTCEELRMMPQRVEVLDHTIPLRTERLEVVVRKVDSFELYWGSFLQPFNPKVWIAAVCTMMLLAVFLWLIYKAGRHYWADRLNGKIVSFHLHDSFFYVLDSFCQQAHNITPNSASGRLVYLASYLSAVVLLAGYSASLISYLTVRSPSLPFTTFRGLLEDGAHKFGMTASSAPYLFFKETNDSLIRQLFLKYIQPYERDLPVSNIEGLRRVCAERFAFITGQEKIRLLSGFVSCQVATLPRAYIPGSKAMAVAKGSPYLRLLSHCLLKLRSTGILQRLLINTSIKQTVEESQFVTMDIVSLTPVFAILAVGMAVAFVILVVEIIVRHLFKHNSRLTISATRINQKPHMEDIKLYQRKLPGKKKSEVHIS